MEIIKELLKIENFIFVLYAIGSIAFFAGSVITLYLNIKGVS